MLHLPFLPLALVVELHFRPGNPFLPLVSFTLRPCGPLSPTSAIAVELHFRPGNPFFPNLVLRKRYKFQGNNAAVSRVALVSSEVRGARMRRGYKKGR